MTKHNNALQMDNFDITSKDYDPAVSRIPELIGKHPGVIAPVIMWKPNPLEFIKPASASRVSGIMEVELKIRAGNEELEKNLKKIILTIDGQTFEFDKPPYKVNFDTSHAHYPTDPAATSTSSTTTCRRPGCPPTSSGRRTASWW